MNIKTVAQAKTIPEAVQFAVDWQNWQSEQSLSYGEISEWQAVFTELADKFYLHDVFKENGII